MSKTINTPAVKIFTSEEALAHAKTMRDKMSSTTRALGNLFEQIETAYNRQAHKATGAASFGKWLRDLAAHGKPEGESRCIYLSKKDRRTVAVWAKEGDGLTYQEIADLLDCSIGSVHGWCKKAAEPLADADADVADDATAEEAAEELTEEEKFREELAKLTKKYAGKLSPEQIAAVADLVIPHEKKAAEKAAA